MRQRSINSFNNVSVMSAPKTNAYFMTPWELDELPFITHKRTLSSRFPPNHFIMSIRITIKVLMKPNQTSGSGGDNPIRFVRVDNQQVPMNITAQFKSVSERYIIGCPPTGWVCVCVCGYIVVVYTVGVWTSSTRHSKCWLNRTRRRRRSLCRFGRFAAHRARRVAGCDDAIGWTIHNANSAERTSYGARGATYTPQTPATTSLQHTQTSTNHTHTHTSLTL